MSSNSPFDTFLYNAELYAGSSPTQPVGLNFARTETDNEYLLYWTFSPALITPSLINLDFQLQIDTDPAFGMPTIFETTTQTFNVIAAGQSLSAAYAATTVSSGVTLLLNIDGDGIKTITLGTDTSGNAIAADIQAKVRALTATNPSLQASYNNFTAVFSPTLATYQLLSGSTGYLSSVVVSGGTAAASLLLGLAHGGYEARGNSVILSSLPGGILIVNDNTTTFLDVSSTTNIPGPEQFVASLPFSQITFNATDLPATITVCYYPSTSAPIISYDRGNVAKGFVIPVPDRLQSIVSLFYAQVCVKNGMSFGPFSESLTVNTIPSILLESVSRLLGALPDFHVYPVDNAYALRDATVDNVFPSTLPPNLSNIAKVYLAYAYEFDRIYLEKEEVLRDCNAYHARDDRLAATLGALYGYPQPSTMSPTDYRLILTNLKAASLNGATYNAASLVCTAFTGVPPTITPISDVLNFITANGTQTVENIVVSGTFSATLSAGTANDPIIPGSLISGAVATVTDSRTVSSSSPYTVTLSHLPAGIPSISGYTFTTGTPTASQFSVNFATGVLTFNSAAAGASISITYTPNYNVAGQTIIINIDGDGAQTITMGSGPFNSKTAIAAEIQTLVRALTAATPSNQPSYSQFLALYNPAVDTYTLVSGNPSPTTSSSVVVSGGTAAAPLRLLTADGAIQTTGLVYKTPPTVPAAGQFVNNIVTGNGSILTFPASQAGNSHTVVFLSQPNIFSYLPAETAQTEAIPSSFPYTVALSGTPCDIPTVAPYLSGTVSVTKGSSQVVGTSTTFTASVSVGDTVVFASQLGTNVSYTVESVTDNTHLTLTSTYSGTTNSSTTMSDLTQNAYVFVPTPSVAGSISPVLATNQFTCDFASPSNLIFAASAAGQTVAVTYTADVPLPPTLYSNTEAGFGIQITLNNPGEFNLDLTNISYLLTKILPAWTKFILVEAS